MSFVKPTKLELAVHETGHAYAFAALIKYERPSQLGIATEYSGGHHGWCTRRTILQREVEFENLTPDVRPSWIWQAEVETAIAMAGPLAEFRHRMRSRLGGALFALSNAENFLIPDAFDTIGDFQRVRDSLAHIADPDPLGTVKRMIDVVDGILAANWSNIQRLSRLLFKRGLLEEAELNKWFDRHPAHFHHHPMQAAA